MIEYNKIECPSCKWNPNAEKLWTCNCGHIWDTFTTKGQCPKCATKWEDTFCPLCSAVYKHGDWYPGQESKFDNMSNILKLPIPSFVAEYWNLFYNKNKNEQIFQYQNFNSYRLLTPKEVLFITHKLPETNDKIHVNNTYHSLKEKKRIDDETYQRFRSAMPTDLVLVARDYKNRLHKYQFPFFEIDSIIPIAVNISDQSYFVLGFSQQKSIGIYLVNDHLPYPIFITSDIHAFYKEITFLPVGESKGQKGSYEFDHPILKIKEIEMHEDLEFSEFESELGPLLQFYESELQRVFNLNATGIYENRNIELKVILDGKTVSCKLSTKENFSHYSIIDTFNSFLNHNLSQKYGLDYKYAFYRLLNIISCYEIDKILEGVRQGLIDTSKDLYLPRHAFSKVQYPDLNRDYLKDKPVNDWDENTKLVFLSDLSRY